MELSLFKRSWGIADACVAIGIFSLLFVQAADFARDPGVGWHLKTGELILSSAAVPHTDPFLHLPATMPGPQGVLGSRAWVSDQWLSDVALSALFQFGSWPLLFWLGFFLFLFTFFSILYKGLISCGYSYIAAALASITAFKLAQVHFILRPVLFAFLFFALLLIELFSIRKDVWQGGAFALRRRSLLVAALFLLWANLHPSFVLGLLLLAFLTISFLLDGALFEKAPERSKQAALNSLWLTLIGFLATLINPYCFDLHRSIAALGQSAYFMQLNEEWHSPNFQEYSGFLFEVILLFVLGAALLIRTEKRRFYSFEIFSFLLFAHAALQSIRLFPFFGIVAAPVLAGCLDSLKEFPKLTSMPILRLLPQACANLERREARSWRGQPLVWMASLSLLIAALAWPERLLSSVSGIRPSAQYFPYAALEYLRQESGSNSGAVVAATPNWGGFITMLGHPRIRALIDDRNTLIGERFYREYFEKLKVGADWHSYLGALGATHLLLMRDSPLAAALLQSGKLAVLHQDAVAILFKYE